MKKRDIRYIKEGIHAFAKEMRKINEELKRAQKEHKKRFNASQSSMKRGIRKTDGRL